MQDFLFQGKSFITKLTALTGAWQTTITVY